MAKPPFPQEMETAWDGPRCLVRLHTGEEILDTLGDLADQQGIRAAAIPMGIGQLRSARLGYWNGQEYEAREISEPTELVALAGSIADAEGRPSVHLHATLGERPLSTVSGHLLRGTVGLLAEVLVESFPGRTFFRPMDESLGLRTLRLGPPPAPTLPGRFPPTSSR